MHARLALQVRRLRAWSNAAARASARSMPRTAQAVAAAAAGGRMGGGCTAAATAAVCEAWHTRVARAGSSSRLCTRRLSRCLTRLSCASTSGRTLSARCGAWSGRAGAARSDGAVVAEGSHQGFGVGRHARGLASSRFVPAYCAATWLRVARTRPHASARRGGAGGRHLPHQALQPVRAPPPAPEVRAPLLCALLARLHGAHTSPMHHFHAPVPA